MKAEKVSMEDGEIEKAPNVDEKMKAEEVGMEDGEIGKASNVDEKTKAVEVRMEDGEIGKASNVDEKMKAEEVGMEDGEIGKAPNVDEKMKAEEVGMEDGEIGKASNVDEKTKAEEVGMEDGEIGKASNVDEKTKAVEVRMEDGEIGKARNADEKMKEEEVRMEDGEIGKAPNVDEKMKEEEVRMEDGEIGKTPNGDEEMNTDQVNPNRFDPNCNSPQKLYKNSKKVNKRDNQDMNVSRQRRVRLSALILLAFSVERIGYYGVQANLVVYSSTHIGFGDLDAATIFSVYLGFNLMFSFVVGILSDAFIGTFRTTVISYCVYILGLLLLPISDLDWSDVALSEEARKAIFLSSLFLVAMGSGGYLATMLPFGAYHIEPLGEKATSSFYMWAYWAQNVPLLLVFSVVVYLQQDVSFFWGYFLLFCATVVSFLIFLSGKNYYIKPEVDATAIKLFFSVLRDGMCGRRRTSGENGAAQSGFLAKAKSSCGGRHPDKTVENVKDLLKVIPVALFMIPFWCTYLQYGSSFVSQAMRMDLSVGDFQVPASSLALVNVTFVILIIPLFSQELIPFMEKIGHPLTPFRRMAIGMAFLILGVITAGLFEIYRKEEMDEPGCSFIQEVSDKNFTASCVSVFLQIPQYSLYAISEIFTVPAAQELSFVEAPDSMKTVVSGMFVAAMGLGGLGATAIARIVTEATRGDNAWLGNEVNEVNMENFFFLLAVVMGLNLMLLVVFAHFYKYRNQRSRPRSQSVWTIISNFSKMPRMSFSNQGARFY